MFNRQVTLKLTSKDLLQSVFKDQNEFENNFDPTIWVNNSPFCSWDTNICFVLSHTGSLHLPTTVGSKSTKTALGTCLPAPVSLKKVLKESSAPLRADSSGIWPSGRMPCSRQYNSQHALPICTPAWPTWTEMHSRWEHKAKYCCQLLTRGRECRDVTQH